MEFDYILYDETESVVNEYASIYIGHQNAEPDIRYFINIGVENYNIRDNLIIIDDEYLMRKKRKLIKMERGKRKHLNKYSVEEILKYNEQYLLFFGNGYFIATSEEDLNGTDLRLEPNEWKIKELLE